MEVLGLVNEIESSVRSSYVNNVYSLGEAQIIRFRRREGDDVWLVASPRYGAWVSAKANERAETTEFTSKLRGELARKRFSSARQIGLDRIYDISFGEGEELRHLIVEMMPPGNLVVTDGSGRISLVLRQVRTPRRRVVRGETYNPPEQKRVSPEEVDGERLARALRGGGTAGRALGRELALPRKYIGEVIARAGGKEDVPAESLVPKAAELARAARELVLEARERPYPCVCRTESGEEVFAVRPSGLVPERSAASLSELCDSLFLEAVVNEVTVEEDPQERARKEAEATALKLREGAALGRKEAAALREAAAKGSRAPTLDAALEVLRGVAGLDAGALKEAASPASAASLAYARAKELEKRAEESERAAQRLEKRQARPRPASKSATVELARRKTEWYEKFRWFFTSGGKLAIGGRDAQSNDLLVKRHMEPGDTVYHADLFGSPFFVLKGGAGQSEEEVSEVAQATVSFSSAWKTGLGAADAYWVTPDQVMTAAPSGEYLARGSFAIRGKKNYVPKNLVQLAIGLSSDGRVVSGPEAAVGRGAEKYVVIVPHREKQSETAKKVAKEIRGEAPVSLDEVARAMPAGGGKILRRGSGGPQFR